MADTIKLTFTPVVPQIVLISVTPIQAQAAFAAAVVGNGGDAAAGFATDPMVYYILSRS